MGGWVDMGVLIRVYLPLFRGVRQYLGGFDDIDKYLRVREYPSAGNRNMHRSLGLGYCRTCPPPPPPTHTAGRDGCTNWYRLSMGQDQ